MSNKGFRFDKMEKYKKKSSRNNKIDWSDSLSVICRHILMLSFQLEPKTMQTIESNMFMDVFHFISSFCTKKKQMKPNENYCFHSFLLKQRNNEQLKKRDANVMRCLENNSSLLLLHVLNEIEEGERNTITATRCNTEISKYLCRLYYTIYASLIMSVHDEISNWIVCAFWKITWKSFSLLLLLFILLNWFWLLELRLTFWFYSTGLVFGRLEMSITIVFCMFLLHDLNGTTQWKRPAEFLICVEPKIKEKCEANLYKSVHSYLESSAFYLFSSDIFPSHFIR